MSRASRWLPAPRRAELRALASRSRQVVILAAVTGALTGLLVAGFERLVVEVMVEHLLEQPLWVIAIAPCVGLLVAYAARRYIGGGVTPGTADEYIRAFHDPDVRLDLRSFAARMTAAVATLGSGGPMGLEGPSLYAGSSIGATIQRAFSRFFGDADRQVLLVSGAAAGVAAIFKAPATGAVFAIEVPYQDDLARRMLLPALVSGASGYLVLAALNGTAPLFPVDGSIDLAYRDLIGAVLLGLLAGFGARGFAWMLRRAKEITAGPHPFLAALAGGATLAALFVAGRALTGESLLVGPGYEVVRWASTPGRATWLLLAVLVLRCVATSATVAGGGVGGVFVPLVVAGALTGSAVGATVNRGDLSLFIVVGVAAFLGAGYRVPLAAVMFVAETTGRPAFIVPGVLAAVAAELVMGRDSVTPYQRIADREAREPERPGQDPGVRDRQGTATQPSTSGNPDAERLP